MKFFLLALVLFTFVPAQMICVISEHNTQWGGYVTILDGDNGWAPTTLGVFAGYCSYDDNGLLWLVSLTGQLYSTDGIGYISMHGTSPGGVANDISAHNGRIFVSNNEGVAEYDTTTGSFQQIIYSSAVQSIEHSIDEDSELYCVMSGYFVVSHNLDYPGEPYFYPIAPGYIRDFSYGYYPVIICDYQQKRARMEFDGENWVSHDIIGPLNRIDVSLNGDVVESANLTNTKVSYIILNDLIISTSSNSYTGDVAITDIGSNP